MYILSQCIRFIQYHLVLLTELRAKKQMSTLRGLNAAAFLDLAHFGSCSLSFAGILLPFSICMYACIYFCELKYERLLILISVSFSFLPPLFFLQQLKIVDDLKRALAESSGVCL